MSYTSLELFVQWNDGLPDEHSSFPGGDFDGAFVATSGAEVCATLEDIVAPGVYTILVNGEIVDALGLDYLCTGGSNPLNWQLGGVAPAFTADGTPLTVSAADNAVANAPGTGCDLEIDLVVSP